MDSDGPYSKNQPFLVRCEFPSNVTIIGKDTEIVMEKCSGDQCFEAPISYDMPIDQMKQLFAISGTCKQTITFICKLAPLQVRNYSESYQNSSIVKVQTFHLFMK